MYPQFFEKISAPLRRRPAAVRALALADKALVVIVAIAFLGIGAWLAVQQDARIVRYLAV